MKNIVKYLAFGGLVLGLSTACKKEPDQPPVNQLSDNSVITIDSLRKWQESVGGPILIEDTLSVFGIVGMDETSGNIYKNIYLQGDSAAVNVRFTSSTDLVQGDSIRISLQGITLSEYSGVIQLDGVDEETNVVVQAANKDITPLVLTIPEIDLSIHESKLIKLENVQFKTSELNNTYADAVNQSSENRTFEDFDGNELYIRTSGFADFAGDSLPKGSGSMVCIVSEYNGELQLILRSAEEAQMDNPRGPGEILVKDFGDDDITSDGWSIQQVTGTHTWETGSLGGWEDAPYAVISNYDGGNTACESWLISPSIDLSTSTAANLSFDNAYNYTGDALEVLISSDYPGTGNPNDYTWFALTANWSTGGWEFVNSGNIDLGTYLVPNVHIAFKYTGSDSDGSTWEIDNIIING